MNQSIPKITMNDGVEIPAIGFGTYNLKGNEGVKSLESAIDAGYRLLDTAYNYENEGTVGEAIRRTSVPREDIIVTSKLPGRYHEYDKAIPTIEESLYRANLDYYDMYLIHWPNPAEDIYVEAWQALIKAQEKGLVTSIGVCNFLPEHIERLERETGVKPAINQVELHPFFNQEAQRKWHEDNDVITQSWSPITRSTKVFDNEVLQEIAKEKGRTIAQVILRWHHQLGAMPIPKSSSSERQVENISIFDFTLSEDDMRRIASLTMADGRRKGQDPATYSEF